MKAMLPKGAEAETHHERSRHQEMEQHSRDPTVVTWIEAARAFSVQELLMQRSRQFSGGIATLNPNDTLQIALDTLQKNDVLSAPVLGSRKEVVGMVDVLDIAAYALDYWKQRASHDDWRGYSGDFFKAPLSHVLNYSKMDLPFVVTQRSSIAEVIRMFGEAGRTTRPHRALVLNDNGEITGIISQSDLVYFIYCTRNQMPRELLDRTLRSLNQINGCVSVRLDTAFSETLELLYRNKVSAVPLLDDQYRICGNFSASDLRGLAPKSFDYFTGSTIQFLTKCTRAGLGAPVWVGEDVSLEVALESLVKNRVHRVYITNAHGLPTGVFSLTDVLEIFGYLVRHSGK